MVTREKAEELMKNAAKEELPSVEYSNAFIRGDIELVKCSSDPERPEYRLEDQRNPKIYPDVRLPGDTHLSLARVRARVRHYTGVLPFPGWKQEDWIRELGKKLDKGETRVEFSPDTSLEADILAAIHSWFSQRGEGEAVSDLQAGGYLVKEENGEPWLYFYPKARSLKHYIDTYVDQKVDKGQIWSALKRVGVKYKKQKVSGSRHVMHCWGVPKLNLEAAIGIEEEIEEQAEMRLSEDL